MHHKVSKKDHILQSLVILLERSDNIRITTVRLAQETGVSEAALYKHFPSKAHMFEELIDFIEKTIFTRVNLILAEEKDQLIQLEKIMKLLLLFVEKNPGLCRILTREVLINEHKRLQTRVEKLFDRIETQIRQLLKEAEIHGCIKMLLLKTTITRLFINLFDGRINQYVRSNFQIKPTEDWDSIWSLFKNQLFTTCTLLSNTG